MKQLALMLAVVMMCSVAYGLTAEEETFVEQLYNNRSKLVELYNRSTQLSSLADNITSETIPLDLEVLRQERQAIIDARDVELQDKDVEKQAEKQVIINAYETQIDAKESEINAKKAELDALINP